MNDSFNSKENFVWFGSEDYFVQSSGQAVKALFCRVMDKGREVFRQADVFLKIAAENGVVPEAQEPKEVRDTRD